MICEPHQSWDMHERMIKAAEELYQSLGFAYRVVTIVSKELNNAAVKKYDLEAWFPAYQEYRELVSCSNCTDYQARSMDTTILGGDAPAAKQQAEVEAEWEAKGIKLPVPPGSTGPEASRKRYPHFLNSTLVASTRVLCCLLENYQTPRGIKVPDVLVPYMGGTTFIPFVRPPPINVNAAKMAKAKGKKEGDAGAAQAQKGKGGKGKAQAAPKEKQASAGKPKAPAAAPASQPAPSPAAGSGARVAAAAAKSGTPEGRPSLRMGGVGLAHLNARLASLPYVGGFAASAEDVAVLRILEAAPLAAAGAADEAAAAAAPGTTLAAAAGVALGAVIPPAHHVRYPHLVRWLKRTQAMRADDWKAAGVAEGAVAGFEPAPVSAYFRG